MLINILTLVASLAVLIIGAEWLISGSSSLAKRLGVPSIIVGFTVVAFGTSLPEFVVSMFSIYSGSSDLAIGNIVGSNIANIGLILGIAALIRPLYVRSATTRREIPLMFIALFVATVLSADIYLNKADVNILSRGDGIILLTLFAIFALAIFVIIKGVHQNIDEKPPHSLLKEIVFIIGGLAGLVMGGRYVVDSALSIATLMGYSSTFVGLLIVAIGTSLPELATSIIAVLKKEVDIAVGSIVGSNIFNTALILGLSATITPIVIPNGLILDLILMTLFGVLLYLTTQGDRKITRSEGAFLLTAYICYIILISIRG